MDCSTKRASSTHPFLSCGAVDPSAKFSPIRLDSAGAEEEAAVDGVVGAPDNHHIMVCEGIVQIAKEEATPREATGR